MTTRSYEDLHAEVHALSWYHRIELPHGITTPGVVDASRALSRLRLPERLDGKEVLDIGAWDGFYSFEAKRRGAARVLATDSFSWSGGGWGSKSGFLLARDAMGLDVEDADVDVLDLDPAQLGTFDLVLLLGVLYHLRDPITAIERAAALTRSCLVIETETAFPWRRIPSGRLFAGSELNNDDTNWWSLNAALLEQLLRRFGFSRVERVYRTSTPRRLARAAVLRTQAGTPVRQSLRSQRIVLHAYKDPGS